MLHFRLKNKLEINQLQYPLLQSDSTLNHKTYYKNRSRDVLLISNLIFTVCNEKHKPTEIYLLRHVS
jgi:hypothetical protein